MENIDEALKMLMRPLMVSIMKQFGFKRDPNIREELRAEIQAAVESVLRKHDIIVEAQSGMKNLLMFEQFVSELNEKEYNADEREEMAKSGEALPDGSFPIASVADLKNAIQAFGRSKDQPATAKHIVKRAKALGAEDLIPDTEDFQKELKS
jgi:hypothetical protein